MPGKQTIKEKTEQKEIEHWARPIQLVLEGIEDAQQGLHSLYKLCKPQSFVVLEALVDCNNHLVIAEKIANAKLAQLQLPEKKPAAQPALPPEKEAPHDQG